MVHSGRTVRQCGVRIPARGPASVTLCLVSAKAFSSDATAFLDAGA